MEINFNPAIKRDLYQDIWIKRELEKLGLQPTGTKEGDIKAIQSAIAQKGSAAEDNINIPDIKQQPPKTPEAVAAFMQKLGLEQTNSKEGDAAIITQKLDELDSKAQNPSDKDNVGKLREEFAAIVAQSGTIGQEQAAIMNKSFFKLQS